MEVCRPKALGPLVLQSLGNIQVLPAVVGNDPCLSNDPTPQGHARDQDKQEPPSPVCGATKGESSYSRSQQWLTRRKHRMRVSVHEVRHNFERWDGRPLRAALERIRQLRMPRRRKPHHAPATAWGLLSRAGPEFAGPKPQEALCR